MTHMGAFLAGDPSITISLSHRTRRVYSKMFERIVESKVAFAIAISALACTLTTNVSRGTELPLHGSGIFLQLPITAHGPSLPPDPWSEGGRMPTGHGPSL